MRTLRRLGLAASILAPVEAAVGTYRTVTKAARRLGQLLFWLALAVIVAGQRLVAWWQAQAVWVQLLLLVAVLVVLLRAPLLRRAPRLRLPSRRTPAVKVSREPIPQWLRQQVIARDDGICGICGFRVKPGTEHIDHIHPVHAGGTNDLDNLQCAHSECNLRKGGMVGWQPPFTRESA